MSKADAVDLKLVKNKTIAADNDLWDLEIANDGDLSLEYGFDTNLILSLFCERRASSYEVPLPWMRRGWWGNTIHDDRTHEDGSKLWLLDQSRLTVGIVNLAKTYSEDALKWLVRDGHVEKVEVEASPDFSASSLRSN